MSTTTKPENVLPPVERRPGPPLAPPPVKDDLRILELQASVASLKSRVEELGQEVAFLRQTPRVQR